MNMMKLLFFFISTISVGPSWAASSSENLTITPIVGVERIQKLVPTPTMKTRTIFGARALYKLPVGAAEAEYTHGQDSSYDSASSTTYKDVGDKAKIGLRGSLSMGPFLSSYLRGGAQGKQTKLTKTVSGASSTTSTTTKVNPYVGTGLAIHLMQFFSLTADVTAVYAPTSTGGLSDYEISPTIGFSVSL